MARRNHRPTSPTDGRCLCWDVSTHDGCRCPEYICPMWKHEIVKTNGLRPLILMQLLCRGGHLAWGKYIRRMRVVMSKHYDCN